MRIFSNDNKKTFLLIGSIEEWNKLLKLKLSSISDEFSSGATYDAMLLRLREAKIRLEE